MYDKHNDDIGHDQIKILNIIINQLKRTNIEGILSICLADFNKQVHCNRIVGFQF